MDPASRLLEIARAQAAREGKKVTFLPGEAASLPVGDSAVDVILSVFALIFVPGPGAAAAGPDRPDASATLVRTPSGGQFDVADPALAAELGPGVRVIKQNRGVFDTMPLSLLTTQTLASLGRLAGTGLAAGRFRPILLVEACGGDFPEDAWVGRVLRIGGLRMRVDQRDKRCVMVTIDPVTLRRDPAVLRVIARERDTRLGVRGSTVEPGPVAVGDLAELGA